MIDVLSHIKRSSLVQEQVYYSVYNLISTSHMSGHVINETLSFSMAMVFYLKPAG